ncbi:MAG: DUF6364 family protein [Balneolaceae bacterium]
MNKKLTLTIEEKAIKKAKKYAADEGRSLSDIVENYFKLLSESEFSKTENDFSPRVTKLKGALKVAKDFNYKKVLEEELDRKYNG